MADTNRCCPELPDGKKCDYLDFVYRLTHVAAVEGTRVPVEVAIHVRLERCTGPYQLGNLVYSTTLLPGERVRLFTTDRRSRFTFDSETQLSYRQEHEAEEQTYADSMSRSMSDLESSDRGGSSASSGGSSSSSAGTSGLFETIFSGPSVSMSGTYDAHSTRDFVRELRTHAESSHNQSVQITRRASSVSVGEVQTRTHSEGESESHLESSSRTFANPNKCHAVSYLFYQVNKEITVRLSVQTIRLRVKDPATPNAVVSVPLRGEPKLHVIPTGVLATSPALTKLVAERDSQRIDVSALRFASGATVVSLGTALLPISPAVRTAALDAVTKDLVKADVIDKEGKPSPTSKRELEFEFRTSIPTPGIVVKGCLDDCNTCEPARRREIELDLERLALNNKLLAKQIELLEKSQEYRCCPPAETPSPADA